MDRAIIQNRPPMRIFDIAPPANYSTQHPNPAAPQCDPSNKNSILAVSDRVETWRSVSESSWEDPQVPWFCTDFGSKGNPCGAIGSVPRSNWSGELIGSTPSLVHAMPQPHEETNTEGGYPELLTEGQVFHFSAANHDPQGLRPRCSQCPPITGESFIELQHRRYPSGGAHSIYLDFTPLRLQLAPAPSPAATLQVGHQSHLFTTIVRTAAERLIKRPMIIELETSSLSQKTPTVPRSMSAIAPTPAVILDVLGPLCPSNDFVAPPSWICWVSNSDVDSVLGWSHRIRATLWNQDGFNSQPTRGGINIHYSLQVFNIQAIPIPLPSVNGLTAAIVISPV